jgi:hypothetical protein
MVLCCTWYDYGFHRWIRRGTRVRAGWAGLSVGDSTDKLIYTDSNKFIQRHIKRVLYIENMKCRQCTIQGIAFLDG